MFLVGHKRFDGSEFLQTSVECKKWFAINAGRGRPTKNIAQMHAVCAPIASARESIRPGP
jgi:hypothetical protein